MNKYEYLSVNIFNTASLVSILRQCVNLCLIMTWNDIVLKLYTPTGGGGGKHIYSRNYPRPTDLFSDLSPK